MSASPPHSAIVVDCRSGWLGGNGICYSLIKKSLAGPLGLVNQTISGGESEPSYLVAPVSPTKVPSYFSGAASFENAYQVLPENPGCSVR